MRFLFAVVLILASVSFSDTATQTDWSGGSGVSGRVVASYSQELPGGTHSVSFNDLAEGVYFCTMRAGDIYATERIIVLK
ncbi:MAG: T9SS type A sorting domain-containing protein [Candidatus Sabulitectum sp.]|nr:T9SS type A sorting domain-containing protein [Candidatus Sabulitectum sp.]